MRPEVEENNKSGTTDDDDEDDEGKNQSDADMVKKDVIKVGLTANTSPATLHIVLSETLSFTISFSF